MVETVAKNKFEKDFLKLKNNVVYGTTMGNIKNHKETEWLGEKYLPSMWWNQTLKISNHFWKSYLLQEWEKPKLRWISQCILGRHYGKSY